jgi:hypothetical protein
MRDEKRGDDRGFMKMGGTEPQSPSVLRDQGAEKTLMLRAINWCGYDSQSDRTKIFIPHPSSLIPHPSSL